MSSSDSFFEEHVSSPCRNQNTVLPRARRDGAMHQRMAGVGGGGQLRMLTVHFAKEPNFAAPPQKIENNSPEVF